MTKRTDFVAACNKLINATLINATMDVVGDTSDVRAFCAAVENEYIVAGAAKIWCWEDEAKLRVESSKQIVAAGWKCVQDSPDCCSFTMQTDALTASLLVGIEASTSSNPYAVYRIHIVSK